MKRQTKRCDRLGFESQEAYKKLRKNLQFSLPDRGECRVIGITSSTAGEGKSTVAVNLAYSFALTGKRILLIDGDMRRSMVSTTLFREFSSGLSELLAGMEEEDKGIRRSPYLENWMVIPGGEVPPNPSELLGSDRMKKLIAHMREQFDYVILDLPPVGIVSDALEASDVVDGMLMVVRQNKTDRRTLVDCVRQLKQVNTRFLGTVMNDYHEEHRSRIGHYRG